jgi:hypothetical protein
VVVEIPVAVTFVRAVTGAHNEPIFVTTVEWIRHHGGNGFVNTIENWWYTTLGAPKEGGRPDTIEAHGITGTTSTTAPVVLTPQLVRLPPPTTTVPTPASPAQPNEGVWTPAGRLVEGVPAIYTTFVRADSVHTSYLTALMWIDTKLLRTVYVAGRQTPGGGPGPWGGMIPEAERGNLIAAFNGAFQIQHARGGAFVDGRIAAPLRDGAASLVVKADGSAAVGQWGRDFVAGPDIVGVRQNLELLVDNGKLNPALREDDTSAFGPTVANSVYVWRSGIGVDVNGALIYAGGPAMSVVSLTKTLIAAGAVTAMELDINSDWVSAYIYNRSDPNNPTSPLKGEKLHPNMSRDGTRYFSAGNPDFFTLIASPRFTTPTTTSTIPPTTTTTKR